MSREDAAEPTVETLVARLREDPVLIDDRFGNGHTEQAAAGLRELVDAADVPTYVVLSPAPDGLGSDPAADLARQLQDRLGEPDATFAIHLGTLAGDSTVVGLGSAPGEDEAFAAQLEHGPRGGGADAGVSAVGLLARDLQAAVDGEDMTGDDWAAYATETPWAASTTWEPGRDYPEAGDAALLTTLLALVTVGAVLLGLRQVPGLIAAYRGRPAPTAADDAPAEAPAYRSPTRSVRDADAPTVRATLTSALDALAERVAGELADVTHPELRLRVEGGQDAARRLADRAGSEHADLPDLVGALVLVRIADQTLADARHGRADAAPYRACLIDPRHGRGRAERDLPVADRSLRVPVCGECAQRPPDRLQPLRVAPGRFGGARDYLETDSVWARTGYGAFTTELWREVTTELDRARS